ncbi:hypothetical protein HK098_004172 [Nowakowskiella sp. JEL0407]|nr:hypothetical protein HK098_004172 [Nowakowskiella sp. JEL0407]
MARLAKSFVGPVSAEKKSSVSSTRKSSRLSAAASSSKVSTRSSKKDASVSPSIADSAKITKQKQKKSTKSHAKKLSEKNSSTTPMTIISDDEDKPMEYVSKATSTLEKELQSTQQQTIVRGTSSKKLSPINYEDEEIEKILTHKFDQQGNYQFLVKWLYCEQTRWEKQEDLTRFEEEISNYWIEHRRNQPSSYYAFFKQLVGL